MVKLNFTANPEVKLPVLYDRLSISKKHLVKEAYIEEQGGLCYYCRAPLDGEPDPDTLRFPLSKGAFPPNFFKYPVHLHHCHKTGLTLGVVHAYCNGVLWQYHGE